MRTSLCSSELGVATARSVCMHACKRSAQHADSAAQPAAVMCSWLSSYMYSCYGTHPHLNKIRHTVTHRRHLSCLVPYHSCRQIHSSAISEAVHARLVSTPHSRSLLNLVNLNLHFVLCAVCSALQASRAGPALPAALGAPERPANVAAGVGAPISHSLAAARVTGGRRTLVTAAMSARMQRAQVGCSAG
jgi:hypothetical protein